MKKESKSFSLVYKSPDLLLTNTDKNDKSLHLLSENNAWRFSGIALQNTLTYKQWKKARKSMGLSWKTKKSKAVDTPWLDVMPPAKRFKLN